MPRFQIELDEVTVEGLALCATEDLRELPKQAAWMLRQAVKARLAQAEALRRLEEGGVNVPSVFTTVPKDGSC